MARSNKNNRYVLIRAPTTLSITQTSDKGFVELIQDLHAMVETISGTDGVQIKVDSVTIGVRLDEDSDDSFTVLPVVVQTAGNLTSQTDLASSKISELINSSCDDVFGYYALGNVRISRSHPTIGTNSQKVETTVQLPQHLVNLLNKETETERLQSLIVALVGKTFQNNVNLEGQCWIVVEYHEFRKNIVIR
jgi:hypothetical protein